MDGDLVEYQFEIEVNNNGTEAVERFDLFGELNEITEFFSPAFQATFEGTLLPGESTTLEGTFAFLDQVSINIGMPGSDFKLDANPEDNFITVDVQALSNYTPSIHAFSIFPNPSQDRLFIESQATELSYRIYDAAGRATSAGTYKASGIDLRDIATGSYFIIVSDSTGQATHRFIKE